MTSSPSLYPKILLDMTTKCSTRPQVVFLVADVNNFHPAEGRQTEEKRGTALLSDCLD